MSFKIVAKSMGEQTNSPECIEQEKASICYSNMAHPERDPQSQDALCILADENGSDFIFAIADGAGGHRNPAEASSGVLQELAKDLQDSDGSLDAIVSSIESANSYIRQYFSQSHSTLVLGIFRSKTLRTIHIGDSKLVILGGRGKLKFETVGHNLQEICIESGLDTFVKDISDVPSHVVTNLMGSPHFKMEISPLVEIAPYDTIVMGSDGLFDNISLEEMSQFSNDLTIQPFAKKLHSLSQSRVKESLSGAEAYRPDDVAFIVCRFQHL